MTGREMPFFSIIVPTRNRPEKLVACLLAMAKLDYPRDLFEIVVVVDGGAAPPGEQLASLSLGIDLTILTQTHAGPAAARNHGARQARGEYLAFTDDDCLPMPEWLTKLAEGFLVNPCCAIGGRTVNAIPGNRYSTASQFLMDFLYSSYNTASNGARFFASNNLALPADLFRAIGGFSENYPRAAGEDRDFCRKWRQHGYSMVYVSEAIVRHAHDLTLTGFIRQQFNYGRGSFLYHLLAQGEGGKTGGFWPLSLYVKLVTYPVKRARGGQKVSITLLLMLSQLSVAAGRAWERLAICGKSVTNRN